MAKLLFPLPASLGPFVDHYNKWLGIDKKGNNHALRDLAIEYTYGGLPLENLYSDIYFSKSDREPLSATLELTPAKGFGQSVLRISEVSLRQFIPAGLPKPEWYADKKWISSDGLWDERNGGYWELFEDAQYRLELAHSETWRWSIFFKRDGLPIGGATLEGDDRLSDIELVNNCTTTEGFEFRVRMNGRSYHGRIVTDKAFRRFYETLCQRQAGSLPDQTSDLTQGDSNKYSSERFFGWYGGTIYGNSKGWGPGGGLENPLSAKTTIRIRLEKYRQLLADHEFRVQFDSSNIERGDIEFDRFGRPSPYFEKPKVRHLFYGAKKKLDKNGKGDLSRQLPGSIPRSFVDPALRAITSAGSCTLPARWVGGEARRWLVAIRG